MWGEGGGTGWLDECGKLGRKDEWMGGWLDACGGGWDGWVGGRMN